MSFAAIVLAAGYEEQTLPIPSVIFPIIALGLFALLAAVAWSYRDVAQRHSDRVRSDASRGH